MDLTWVLVRADLRRRWRSWLVLALVTGVLAGTVMAAVAGWDRTRSAMDRFLEFNRPANGYVSSRAERADIAAIPGVEAVIGGDYFLLMPVDEQGRPHPEELGKVSPFSHDDPAAWREVGRPIVVSGRLADPERPLEVTVDEEMAELYDLAPGDRLTMQAYAPDQIDQLYEGLGSLMPTGAEFDFTVTGIVRSPEDVVSHQRVPEVVYLGSAAVYLGPAFDAAHRNRDVPSLGALFGDVGPEGSTGYELRVDLTETSRADVTAAARALDDEAFVDFSGNDALRARDEAARSIDLQATMLLALAAVVAAGGAVLVVQGFRRQLELDRAVQRSIAELGSTRRSAVAVASVKAAAFAAIAVTVAWVVAVALSPLTPVGHARRAEIDPGPAVDVRVLGLGGIALALLVLAGMAASAWAAPNARRRAARRGVRRTGGLAGGVARAGLPAPVVAGLHAARVGTGSGTVLVSVFVAAAALVGATGFVLSEERLASRPELWGWTFDAVLGDGNDPAVVERAEATLADEPRIEGYALRVGVESLMVESGRRSTELDATALLNVVGHIEPRMLEGAPPRRADEIALGGSTARQLGVSVGDEVAVDGGGGPVPFEVSGLAVMPLAFDVDRIGVGAILDPAGLERLGPVPDPSFVLVDYADGVDPDAMYHSLREDWGNTVLRPIRSVDVQQLHALRFLPVIFGGLLATVAAVTLVFVLVLSIRRRRRDLAVLRTLGFEGRQLRSTVSAQAAALVLPGAALGTLVGAVLGRQAWRWTAQGMGAPDVTVLPAAAMAVVVAGALLLGWVIAVVPGRLAARSRPAVVLRTE